MYERMLDKAEQPTWAAFSAHCGARAPLLARLDAFLRTELGAAGALRFPYGNKYGWGVHYTLGRRHLCDVFAERDALCVMLRMTNAQFARVYDRLTPYARQLIDGKYPCGEGGWIHFRVLEDAHLDDLKTLLPLAAQRKRGSL